MSSVGKYEMNFQPMKKRIHFSYNRYLWRYKYASGFALITHNYSVISYIRLCFIGASSF